MDKKQKNSIFKYELKKISTWMCLGPIISFIGVAITSIMLWFGGYADETLWPIFLALLMPTIAFISTSMIDDSWNSFLSQNEKHGKKIDDEYIYTNSFAVLGIFLTSKLICALSSVALILVGCLVLYENLKSVSVAPTTVIIILLVIITYNQIRSGR